MKSDQRYSVLTAYPAGEPRYLILRNGQPGRVVMDNIEDRAYAMLLREAFELMAENIGHVSVAMAESFVPEMKVV